MYDKFLGGGGGRDFLSTRPIREKPQKAPKLGDDPLPTNQTG